MNIRSRLTLATSGMIGLLVLVLGGSLLFIEKHHLLQETEKNHRLNADHLALACNDALLSGEDLGLVDFVSEIKYSPFLLEAFCVTERGRLLIHTDIKKLAAPFGSTALSEPFGKSVVLENGKVVWEYRVPIMRSNRRLAVACVRYDGAQVERWARRRVGDSAKRLATLSVLVLALGIGSSSLMAKAFTRPIQDIASGARRVGQGNLQTRVPETAPGELGVLAKAFNAMTEKLGLLEAMKDQFIHTVSHDLRNPLSAIVTSAKVLLNDPLPEKSHILVEVIESSTVRLRTMVNNILDTAKMREGRLRFVLSTFSVDDMLRELARLYTPLARESGKTLTVDVPADLPPLHADEEKVFCIFLNLLTNAFKFTEKGATILLAVHRVEGSFLEFRVSDTGVGIDFTRRPRLFEAFASTEGADAPLQRRQGTGLGLNIVKRFVEGQGGKIRLDSIVGQGTTITFTLPIQRSPS